MEENSKNYESEEKSKKIVTLDLEKIYSKILGKDFVTYKFNKIILGTKRLISNNIIYNDFSKEYDDITKISSFKYPDINYFPISKNLELISLGKIRYSYDSTKKRVKSSAFGNIVEYNEIKENTGKNKNQNLFLKSCSIKSLSNNIKHINKIKINSANNKEYKRDKIDKEFYSNSTKKIHKYKLLGSPTYKSASGNKNEKQLTNKNNSNVFSSYFSSRKICNSLKDNKNNLDNQFLKKRLLIKNSLLNMFNYQKFLRNNRILLRDTLLNEKDYNDLEYNEDAIFFKTEHYNNFIKSHLNDIKLNNLKYTYPEQLEKIYSHSKYNNTKLILKPITIEFSKIFSFQTKNLDNFDEKQIFEIPFEYTPIFYMHNLSKLKEILSSIFYLNEDFSSFNAKYENFPYLLKHATKFVETKPTSEVFKRNKDKKTFTSKMKSWQSLSLNKASSNKFLKRSSVSTQHKENLKIIDIYNNDFNINPFRHVNTVQYIDNHKNKSAKNRFDIKTSQVYFSNKNSFEFIWLTPNYEYLVNIKIPEINFFIKDFTIKKYIDTELFLFLLEQKFHNWDYYIMEYLFSFCKFCLIINNFLAIYKINKYNLKNNLFLKNKIINLSEEKKVKYSMKNSRLIYIFTDKNNINYIKILHNYKILVYNKKINKNSQFCFHTNYIQMKSLHYSIQKQGVKHLLEKILTLDKDSMKIRLNYDYLDNFCKTDYYNLENLIQKNNAHTENTENKYTFNINDTRVCLYYPNLESIKFKGNIPPNKNENCFESNGEIEIKDCLDFKILEKILKTRDIFKWPNIIEFKHFKKEGSKRTKNPGISLGLNKIMKSVIIKKKSFLEMNEEE